MAGVPGEDADGVMTGVDFLRGVNLGEQKRFKGDVVVVGGGNVAVDVARTVLRMTDGKVTMLCLEGENEMPAAEYDRLKARAAAEYADPQIQDYLERINLYPGTPTAPQLKPVGMPYEVLDEMDWQGFKMWLTDKDSEMD